MNIGKNRETFGIDIVINRIFMAQVTIESRANDLKASQQETDILTCNNVRY